MRRSLELNRRTEYVETFSFGPIHARCMGEPHLPLILYIHGRADEPMSKLGKAAKASEDFHIRKDGRVSKLGKAATK